MIDGPKTSDLTKTILEILRIKSPHFECIENSKANFYRLSYNWGGIIYLWFGSSPLSIDD
jgi:hypothetical protein